ncbi:MAG: hypothetical protein LBC76_05560 [Treponema sp.]|jgi:hypothetical protein|nr:hypothetical protein [Treponema sp.]
MIFKFDIKKTLIDILCSLFNKLNSNSNGNSNDNSAKTITVNININNNNNSGNIINNFNFITTDDVSKIKTFDRTIEKSINITTDDGSLWLYCNTEDKQECFALGVYLISSEYDSDKMAFWIGLHTGYHTDHDTSDESLLKKNLTLIIEFLGNGWEKKNVINVAIKGKGDENYNLAIEKFEEKSPEELLSFIKTKLEEALKDIK